MIRKAAYALTALLTVGVVAVELLHGPVLIIFAVSALALIGLAWVLGQATESLGHHAGPRVGGILNATFGNAAELIITIFALAAGLTTVGRPRSSARSSATSCWSSGRASFWAA